MQIRSLVAICRFDDEFFKHKVDFNVKGWRPTMEDYHTAVRKLDGHEGWDYFAVFDGHIDDSVSKILAERLHVTVAEKIRSLTAFQFRKSGFRTCGLCLDQDLSTQKVERIQCGKD